MAVLAHVLSQVLTTALSSTLAPSGTGRFVTNLALQSQTLNTGWNNVQSTFSINAAVAPDGTTTAEKLVENAAATQQHRMDSGFSIPVVSGAVYTFSIFAKAVERLSINMRISGTATNATTAFNLQTGVINFITTGNATIANYGGGWYRCSITGISDGGATTLRVNLGQTAGSVGIDTYSGDGSSGLYLWGAQFETGSDANTYIPTTNLAVTAEV